MDLPSDMTHPQPGRENNGAVSVIALSGDFVFNEALRMEHQVERILRTGGRRFVVDFNLSRFIDSIGIGILIGSALKVKRGGGIIVLCNLSSHIKEILEKTHITQVCGVAETLESALRIEPA